MADDVEQRVMQGINGTPQLKPDEKREYLGNFRERVIFTLSFQEVNQNLYMSALKKDLAVNPSGHLFLNGELTESQQGDWLTIATENKLTFTFVNDNKVDQPTDLAIVYAADTAINLPEVDLLKKFPLVSNDTVTANTAPTEKKESFWSGLFK